MTVATHPARRLGAVLEPVVGQVYFAPECHKGYVALGFDDSNREVNGVAMPDGPAYFTSRGSILGQVRGDVVAAAFAVFNPDVVAPAVELGWSRTDAATINEARTEGAVGQLRRVLGDEPEGLDRVNELLARAVEPLRPEGRSLYAGLRALGVPDDPLAAMWRRGDMLREYRGDSHITAWVSAGLDATEIGLLTELYWGLPLRTYSRTRAWTTEQFDAATERLEDKGLIADGAFTEAGRARREDIEVRTDDQMRPTLDALGDDITELCDRLAPWGEAIRATNGYPASGPHDLARVAAAREDE
jgi:Helix-turn-helix family